MIECGALTVFMVDLVQCSPHVDSYRHNQNTQSHANRRHDYSLGLERIGVNEIGFYAVRWLEGGGVVEIHGEAFTHARSSGDRDARGCKKSITTSDDEKCNGRVW